MICGLPLSNPGTVACEPTRAGAYRTFETESSPACPMGPSAPGAPPSGGAQAASSGDSFEWVVGQCLLLKAGRATERKLTQPSFEGLDLAFKGSKRLLVRSHGN